MYKTQIQSKLRMNERLTGKNIRIAVFELGVTEKSNLYYDKIINATSSKNSSSNIHAERVGELIRLMKPNAEIFLLDSQSEESAKWVIKNNIDIVTMSVTDTKISLKLHEKMSKNSFLITSAGNAGEKGETMKDIRGRYWWQVAALDEEFKPVSYSSWKRDMVDGATFTDIKLSDHLFRGTSAAAPLYACLIAEYIEVFYNHFELKPNIQMIIDFVIKQSNDTLIGNVNSDLKIGYGTLILPEDYCLEVFTIRFPRFFGRRSLRNILRKKDGIEKNEYLKNPAILIGGRPYISIEDMSLLLGLHSDWNTKKNQLKIYRQERDH